MKSLFSRPTALRLATALLPAVVVLCNSPSPAAADMLYMGDGIFAPNSIFRMDSANPNPTFTVLRNDTELGSIRDIHLDAANNRMYWVADPPLNTVQSALIRVSALDGTGGVTIPVTTPLGQIHGLAVDASQGFIYIATFRNVLSGAPSGIGRIPLAGGSYTPLFTNTSGFVSGIALDPVAGKLYAALNLYDAQSNPNRSIVRMNLNGSNLQTLYNAPGAEYGLEDIEIDVAQNRLVVVHSSNLSDIAVGSLDGAAPLQLINAAGSAHDIALSGDGQRIFYSDISADTIRTINFNGTGDTLLRTVHNVFALESLVPEPALSLLLMPAAGYALLRRRRNKGVRKLFKRYGH